MFKLWSNYKELTDELNEVQKIIEDSLSANSKSVDKVINHVLSAEGKYIRAGLTILSAKCGHAKNNSYLQLAAGIELIHVASLIHDDIIDEASIRRGQRSVQSKYSKEIAVYTGDFIFTKCFSLLAEEHKSHLNLISEAMEKICMGEIIQFDNRYNSRMSVKQYLKIISGKTAVLFALSTSTGAKEGSFTDDQVKRFAKLGYYIGMSFQIIDDCLDYVSDEKKFLKNTGNDLKQGLYTLPLLYAIQNDTNNDFSKFLNDCEFNQENISKIIQEVRRLNGVENSMVLARKYANKAHKEIDTLGLNNEASLYIRKLIDQLLDRTY